MGVLVIKCPNTGRDVATGIQVDSATFARMPNEVTETRCPHCRTKHSWRPRDAKYVEALPPGDWIENQK